MRFCTIILAAAAVASPMAASAQTVTVNKTATPDGVTTFNTISEGLAAVLADTSTPDVVQVTDSETYEEVININAPVTLEAIGNERATIAVLANTNGTPMPGETAGHGGIWINLPDTLSTGTVKIRNFNILPSLTETTISNRLRTAIENGNNNLYLELDNCIITANEHGAPLVTDPYTSRIYAVFPGSSGVPEPYDPTIVMFGGHGIVLGRSYTGYTEGAGVELLLKDTIISHLKNDYHPEEQEKYPTGIVMHSPLGFDPNTWDTSVVRISRIEGASGVSFCDVSLSASGDVNVEGTEDTPVILRGSATFTIRFDGPAFNYRNLSHVTIEGMSQSGILDRGFGPIRFTMNDCRMFMALIYMIQVHVERDGDTVVHPAEGLITISNSTLVNARHHSSHYNKSPIRLEADTQCDLHFENSIIGGRRDQPIDEAITNVIYLGGYNDCTAEGSAFITSGPFSLRPGNPFSRGANATIPPNAAEQYAGDPQFLVTNTNGGLDYAIDPGFLDVQNEEYATLSSTNGPLGGGADYIGGIPSSVSDWSVY